MRARPVSQLRYTNHAPPFARKGRDDYYPRTKEPGTDNYLISPEKLAYSIKR